MGFLDDAQEDIDSFFEDFGTMHTFCGKEMTVIVDDDECEKLNRIWKDAVNQCTVLLFVRESDMEKKLAIGSHVEYDDSYYFVNSLGRQNGVWKIALGRNQV